MVDGHGGEPVRRPGFLVGAAAGLGAVATNDDRVRVFPRVSVPNLKVGAQVSKTFAVHVDVPTGVHRRDGALRAFEGVLLTAQYWVGSSVWVAAGGGALLDFPVMGTTSGGFHVGPGAAAWVGVDIAQRRRWVLDLSARTMVGVVRVGEQRRDGGAVDLLLGATWR